MTLDSYPTYQQIGIEGRGRALWITLVAPPLNPFTNTMQGELVDALRRANLDSSAKVVILTGSGRAFSAGGDIQEMKDKAQDLRHHMQMFSNGVALVNTLIGFEKPIIARINGHAIGLGASVALLCDITIASTTAKIGDPHVRMGLAAGDGGALIWPFLIGLARAKEYLLTGKSLAAEDAAAIGLINHAVAPEELDAKVAEFTTYFENGPGQAINATKIALNLLLRQYALSAADAHMGLEGRTVFSDDHEEAVNAFLENREPRFK